VNSRLKKKAIKDLNSEGKTSVFVAVDHQLVGLIGLKDSLRPEAGDVVKQLQNQGIQVCVE
jgi:P-type E1-E2 ATPase